MEISGSNLEVAMEPPFKISENRLRKAWTEIVETMINMNSFLDHACPELLGREHRDCIRGMQGSDANKIRKMLDFVIARLPHGSNAFLKALVKSGNVDIAESLVPGSSIPFAVVESLPPPPEQLVNKYKIENFEGFRAKCVEYMSDIPSFMDCALEIELLDKQTKNTILAEMNTDDQIREICYIVERKIPSGKSYDFLYALTKSGNDYLVELLLSGCGVTHEPDDFSHYDLPKSVVDSAGPLVPKRVRVVIITFDDAGHIKDGEGCEQELEELFHDDMGFEVVKPKPKPYLSAGNIKSVLEEQLPKKENMEDCFILFILSDVEYSVIFKVFKDDETWNNTPKLIYFQARQWSRIPQNKLDKRVYITYPVIKDGENAYKDPKKGTGLIQSVIAYYRENYKKEHVAKMGIKIRTEKHKSDDHFMLCDSALIEYVYLNGNTNRHA